ncbi:hypothetical protein Selin_1912 [Desulfurispirillum indicum S5]|uniref:Uncharacterized protein n=1 Tax=Desulfurispirillum indicum (strain ATCC BAA-1389 / DSM 22839 / S5) TaxID=653733 RepID=E6W213_DESIS|nr:ABC transporter permease [Desulfurispirillum indicum]ADU66639.1 hypothetical protein Selin_1912 [Desulfurispirillum indicum S5]
MKFFLKEAWHEFRFGMSSGVVILVYLVLVGYLLLVLSNADYLRDMGAVDVPRNAPALVYLMSSGMSFFLFFIWAWVFAQPILRDQAAGLHEVVLASPVSLRQLLGARFVGALAVAIVIGSSQVVGFAIAPVLEWMGAVPENSFAPTPWLAFGWGMLLFIIPLALGSGSLYFVAALRGRSLGAPFAVAAALMGFWMVSMIILKDGYVDPFYFAILDPSGFAETEYQVVDNWTPHQKSTALLALTPGLIWNRLIWCGLPPLLLAVSLLRVRREWLVLERGRAVMAVASGNELGPGPQVLPGPVGGAVSWSRAAASESWWQVRQVLNRRWMWLTLGMLVLLGFAAGFVHGVQHAYGPMVPRPELVTPLLSRNFYLIIVFMLAGLVGLAIRRDGRGGIEQMLDAAPAPNSVRLAGLVAGMAGIALVLVMVPALASLLTALFVAPESVRLVFPFAHQFFVLLPALLEICAFTLLLHILIRRPGPAYAASILAVFIMIVNHEAHLVTYPPLEIGLQIPVHISGLTGLGPWMEKLLVSGGFKLALAALLLALSAMLVVRGTDDHWKVRWKTFRRSLRGRAGIGALAATICLALFSVVMFERYVAQGHYESRATELAHDAAWERHWLGQAAPFTVAGGHVLLQVYPQQRQLAGQWRMEGVSSDNGHLHAALPDLLRFQKAMVEGREVVAEVRHHHVAVPLENCPPTGCQVTLEWTLSARGWDPEHRPPWLVADAYWLHAPDLMPRLGFDANHVLRTPAEREHFGLPNPVVLPPYASTLAAGAAAAAGDWSWEVQVHRGQEIVHVQRGATHGLLDFTDAWVAGLEEHDHGAVTLLHDRSRRGMAASVVEDLDAMGACIGQRMGRVPPVSHILQWPRELGETRLSGERLLLAEAPHWDVQESGVGRWLRRSAIARALAERVILDDGDVREGEGSLWLNPGLSGALGLACVAEADGLSALSALLSHGTDQVARSLAASTIPVTTLRSAPTESGWAVDYAPLALLNLVVTQSSGELNALLADVRQGDAVSALRAKVGASSAERLLGPPLASDVRLGGGSELQITGERWIWHAGGWQTEETPLEPWRYVIRDGKLRGEPVSGLESHATDACDALYLDGRFAYERAPVDNLWRASSPECR